MLKHLSFTKESVHASTFDLFFYFNYYRNKVHLKKGGGVKMKILLLGGNGKLGREIREQYANIYAPTHKECDVANYDNVERFMRKLKDFGTVINAAALVGTRECEQNKPIAWKTNAIGSKNVSRCCLILKKRLVFISSNLIFDGEKGLYSESDTPNPRYFYGLTKVAGEKYAKMVIDHSIIRLDFFSLEGLKYDSVYTDHYTSKIPADEAATKILRVAVSDFVGTINIGQPRASLFKILIKHYPNIKPIRIHQSSIPDFPKDLSFNLEKWKKHFTT